MKKTTIFFAVLIPLIMLVGCEPAVNRVPTGEQVPDDINVIVEIPANSDPIKYEMNKDSGVLFVDRFVGTKMRYPVNYGYVPHTLSNDGDPADVLVITPYPVMSGAVIRVRPIAVLKMEDEAGLDAKILAVPVDKLSSEYTHVKTLADIDPVVIKQIEDFFANYKKSEPGKWVKIQGWDGTDAARREMIESVDRYHKK